MRFNVPADATEITTFAVSRQGKQIGVICTYIHNDEYCVVGKPDPATPTNYERIQQAIRRIKWNNHRYQNRNSNI